MSRNDGLTSRDDVRRSVRGAIVRPGENVSQERWDAIFSKKNGVDGVDRNGQQPAMAPVVPAIHTDRMYTGWDHGLRCFTHGRAHRREIMRARNLRAVQE